MSRYFVLALVVLLSLVSAILANAVHPAWGWPLVLLLPLALLGAHDLIQRQHAIWRNYPIIGHMRFLLETFRAEIRQYFIEGEKDQLPFSLEQRSLVYRRAKQVNDAQPFGTIHNVDMPGYMWMPPHCPSSEHLAQIAA